MFTGIVEEVAQIKSVGESGLEISVSELMSDLVIGGSINVNGTCLTITALGERYFEVDVVPETLRRTNLGSLNVGDFLNLERPTPVRGRLDGHIVQGHIDGTGIIESISTENEALLVKIRAPHSIMRYVVKKAFIAVDGASITVVDCNDNWFVVTVIPYTRKNTVLGLKKIGDVVNLEADIIAKYVEQMLPNWQKICSGRESC